MSDISFDKAFGIHPQALKVWEKRTSIIGNNLANQDTPGFKARDIDFKNVIKEVSDRGTHVSLTKTAQDHIGPSPADLNMALMYREPTQESLDGNTVDSQQEKMAFAENALHYQASLQLLDGKIKGLREAIKGE